MRKQEEGFMNCKNMNYSPEFVVMQKIGYKGKENKQCNELSYSYDLDSIL